jgi:hypothetical protein
MVRRSLLALGAVGGLVAAVGAWNRYQRVTAETVPYTVVGRVGDAELRRYPPTLLVETVAPSENQAFRRLFRYISGANDGGREISMTAPVSVAGRGTEIPMTAPVTVTGRPGTGSTAAATDDPASGAAAEGGVRMGFYLPAEYDSDRAPRPTDDRVELVAVPERTLAVRRFSWWPTDRRVGRETERLLAALHDNDVAVDGDPFYLGYDAPWTLPMLRRNEVAVPVAPETVPEPAGTAR